MGTDLVQLNHRLGEVSLLDKPLPHVGACQDISRLTPDRISIVFHRESQAAQLAVRKAQIGQAKRIVFWQGIQHLVRLTATTIVKTEVLIWLSVLVAVNLVYFLFHSGRLDSENTGLVILLILALATFLAGLRLGWRLCILGALLGGALILATYVEEFLWIVLVVVVAAAAAVYFMARYKSKPKAEDR